MYVFPWGRADTAHGPFSPGPPYRGQQFSNVGMNDLKFQCQVIKSLIDRLIEQQEVD